jgi:pantoate kinase
MVTRLRRAFSPSGISSFFEICDQEENGTPINDPERIGARGGGFALSKGTTTEVMARKSTEPRVDIYINGKLAPQAKTTKAMVNMLLNQVKGAYQVIVKHYIEVPIGAGFGTSAAGALSTGLALSRELGLNLTYGQIGRMAHVADVICHTGLGTVEGLLVGGLVLVVRSGAAGIGLVDRIPIQPNLKVVAGSFGPMNKRYVLLSPKERALVNKLGRRTIKKILSNPSLTTFIKTCKQFAYDLGLMSERVRRLIEDAENSGAIGATQNMLGESVHAITRQETLKAVYEAFKRHLPEEKIIISEIDFQGARLLA